MKKIVKKATGKVLKKFDIELVNLKKADDTKNYIQQFGEESVKNKRFYNVCGGGHLGFGGGFHHPCWRNLDILRPNIEDWDNTYRPDIDLIHDMLMKDPLPIDDQSAEIIQSQYSIEHVHDAAAYHFFKEAYRALKPGGVLKIVVPNIELDYLAYTNNDPSYFAIESMSQKKHYQKSGFKTPFNETTFEQVFLSRFASNATMIHGGDNPNKIDDEEFKHVFGTMTKEDAFAHCSSKCSVEVQKKIRYNHINWWSHDKLIAALKTAGFEQASILAPHQSSLSVLRNKSYFDTLWNYVSLFVEARKSK